MAGTPGLDLGRRVAAGLAASEHADAAFLAGSAVVGLGTGSSDVDVYLVGAAPGDSRRQLVADGVRVDVQWLAAGQLTDLVDRVGATAATAVPEADLVLAVRLLTGQIVSDTGVLTALRDRLVAGRLPVRRRVITGWARTAYSSVEDITGLRESADQLDHDAAITAGRRALLAAGKALAAAAGDLYYGDKWVWRQLSRGLPDAFPLAVYRRLMQRDLPPPGLRAGLAELVAFVQTCLAAAMTLGWWDVSLAHWPSWTGGPGALRRSPDFVPGVSGDDLVIVGPGARTYRVPSAGLLLWGLCGGATPEELDDRLAALDALAEPWHDLRRRGPTLIRQLADAALIAGVPVEA